MIHVSKQVGAQNPIQSACKPAPRLRGLRTLALFAGSLLLGGVAQAQEQPRYEYEPDPHYNSGFMTQARFANRLDDRNVGGYAARVYGLSTTPVVVVGNVPPLAHQQADNFGAIGLSLYTHNGEPQPWTSPDPSTLVPATGNSTIVHPGIPPVRYTKVTDVDANSLAILVLSDTHAGVTAPSRSSGTIDVFDIYGRYRTILNGDLLNANNQTVQSVGLVSWIHSPQLTQDHITHIAYVGRRVDSATLGNNWQTFVFSALKLNRDDWTYTTGVRKTASEIFPNQCTGPAQCTVSGIALGGRNSNTDNSQRVPPKLYISGSRRATPDAPWQIFHARIDAITGEGSDFTLMRLTPTDMPCSMLSSCPFATGHGLGLSVEPRLGTATNDKIFILAEARNGCGFAPLVLSYDGARTNFVNRFHSKVVGLPAGTGGTCSDPQYLGFYPTSIKYWDFGPTFTKALAISGHRCLQPNQCEDRSNGGFTVLNPGTLGIMANPDSYEYLQLDDPINGPLYRAAEIGFTDIVPMAGGRFVLTGTLWALSDSPDPGLRGKTRLATHQLRPVATPIFSDGFE